MFRLAKRTKCIAGLVPSGLADGLDRRLPDIRRRGRISGELGHLSKFSAQPLPRSGQAKRGHLHVAVFAFEIIRHAGLVGVGPQVARTRGVDKSVQRSRLSIH